MGQNLEYWTKIAKFWQQKVKFWPSQNFTSIYTMIFLKETIRLVYIPNAKSTITKLEDGGVGLSE